MNTTEWTPRIATADRYLDAQYLLMASATGNAPMEETLERLDEVRRTRVALKSLPPSIFKDSRAYSPSEASDAVIFLEKNLKLQKNESLLLRWLATAEFPECLGEFERAHGLELDPDHDLLILGENESDVLRDSLRIRKFLRVINISDISSEENPTELDGKKLAQVLKKLHNIEAVRPNRIHYINNMVSDEVRDSHLKVLKDRVELFYISRNTVGLMAPIWTPNILKNTPKLVAEGRDILALSKTYLGSTAVVIGAGPSLDELLPKIAAIQEKVLIICAFKALKAVSAFGIDPDIVVCLDPKQKIRHLEGVDLLRIGAFAVEAASNDELVSTLRGCPILPFVASVLPAELIRAIGAMNIPIMGTGGSAVHGAIQLAILLGSRNIYMAGTDFGFPDNKLYANGAGTGDAFVVAEDGLSYKRQPLDSHHRGGELFPVLANNGATIGASVEMVQFREWTEARIKSAATLDQPCSFFNLCNKGAVIAGAPYVENISTAAINFSVKEPIVQRVLGAKKVAKKTLSATKARLKSRANRLRKLASVCENILSKNVRQKDWSRDIPKLVRQAGRCFEVSAAINDHLIQLDEYTKRVRSVGAGEADNLLIKLVQEAHTATTSVIEAYAAAIENAEKVESSPTKTVLGAA